MKTKSFLILSISIFGTSLFLIVFHSQQPDSLQTIVTQTHQHFKNFQENLREVEENRLLDENKYLNLLGFNNSSPVAHWQNTSIPAIVTYVLDGQYPQAVGFVKNIFAKLPNYTILLYNLGLSRYSLEIISGYCNSSKCMIIDFELGQFPSHVNDERLHAFRPLVIQHALSRVGALFFIEINYRYNGTAEEFPKLTNLASKNNGIIAWARRPAVSSLTHPKMFDYFHTDADSFLFLPMVDVAKLIIVQSADIKTKIMKPWIQCALTHDCILPIGAQSGGCRFDKKPQYRYSGCHSYDSSAFNIVVGLMFSFDESQYVYKGKTDLFVKISNDEARHEFYLLEKNATVGLSDFTETGFSSKVTYKTDQSEDKL